MRVTERASLRPAQAEAPRRQEELHALQQLATELTKRTRSPIALQYESSKQFKRAIDASGLPAVSAASAVDVRKLTPAHLLSHPGELEQAMAWTKLGHEMKPTGEHNTLFLDIPRGQFFAQPLGPDGKDLKGPLPLTPDLVRALEKDMTLDLERAKAALRWGDG